MNRAFRMTGPAMQKILTTLGIPAQQVTRKRATGEYVADFFVPVALGEPITRKHAILSAQAYAQMLREKIPGARITGMGEWKTDWRDNPSDHVRYEAFVSFIVPETIGHAPVLEQRSRKPA